ncbi:DUF3027 domain-containing protein [Bifidobacterium castoris]|uniref:DUF3027 domain-containing protein n=1 Tax=Bifidobacterium castoris TaxID=2306972 RepID=A0A430F808_9BIFI|nr:hypothetical protein D2E22_0945 [Bifidobacterium castoris]
MAEEFDPEALARAVAIDTAQDASHVGDFVTSETTCDGVTDFRFVATMVGYEGWQWSVTLFHDVGADRWTVDEASLIPTDKALLPPPWVPWKDRLEPSDLSVTDSIGTEPSDERLEAGVTEEAVERIETTHGPVDEAAAKDAVRGAQTAETIAGTRLDAAAAVVEGVETVTEAVEDVEEGRRDADGADGAGSATTQQDLHDAIEEFDLSRRSVMSPIGRAQTAQRWYDGPHGPKSLSTKTANGNVCSTCGFFISLRGDLSEMFGVCANRWSPDDGRVVSLDHGCGEHSQIEPPEPSRLWIQTKPAYDDVHIDIVAQSPREERGEVELIETIVDAKRHGVAGGLHGADAADGDDVRREERRAVQGAVVPMPDADAQREAARDAIADEAAADAPRQAQAQQIVDAAEDIVTDEQRETVAATGDEDTIGHTQVVAELTTDAEGEGEDFVDALEAKAEAAQDADAAATTADAGASAVVEPEDSAQMEDAAQQETLERAEIEVENIAGAASDATQGNEDVVEPYQEAHD